MKGCRYELIHLPYSERYACDDHVRNIYIHSRISWIQTVTVFYILSLTHTLCYSLYLNNQVFDMLSILETHYNFSFIHH
jgi:hypothetical protein